MSNTLTHFHDLIISLLLNHKTYNEISTSCRDSAFVEARHQQTFGSIAATRDITYWPKRDHFYPDTA